MSSGWVREVNETLSGRCNQVESSEGLGVSVVPHFCSVDYFTLRGGV